MEKLIQWINMQSTRQNLGILMSIKTNFHMSIINRKDLTLTENTEKGRFRRSLVTHHRG